MAPGKRIALIPRRPHPERIGRHPDRRGPPALATRWGWLLCAFSGCLLIAAVALEGEVGSDGRSAGGVRLPSGATSVTAEPRAPDPDTTVAPGDVEGELMTGLAAASVSAPASDSKPAGPSAPSQSAPKPTQVPTPTTSRVSPPATNAPSQPAETTTTTTVDSFDSAQCSDWLYLLLHSSQCPVALPPLSV